MPHVITSACIDVMDRSCVDECPVDCIYEGARKLYINADECIDCAACVPVCPQNAIFEESHTPEDQRVFADDNVRFFGLPLPGRQEALGMPGGFGVTGRIGVDTEIVAEFAHKDDQDIA